MEMNIKDNPFVKIAPTFRQAYLIEKESNIVRVRVMSKTKDVPYCDCFAVDEEFLCVMPQDCSCSSVLRVSYTLIWFKSTMMKSIIKSNSEKESKIVWTAYIDYVKKNGHFFKEKKKESKLSHGIEKYKGKP
jgi:hypothetical protein